MVMPHGFTKIWPIILKKRSIFTEHAKIFGSGSFLLKQCDMDVGAGSTPIGVQLEESLTMQSTLDANN